MNHDIKYFARPGILAMSTIALVAVLLAVGGPPASADNLTDNHGGDGNKGWQSPVPQTDPPTPEPTPPYPPRTPSPCAAELEPQLEGIVDVISQGNHAVFDVYRELNDPVLITNPCPPTVDYGTETETVDDGLGGTTEVTRQTYYRDQPKLRLDRTVLHVRHDAVQTLAADSATDYAKFPFLYPDAVDTNSDGTKDVLGAPISTQVWMLPNCGLGRMPTPTDSDLCISFSAALLDKRNWKPVPDAGDGVPPQITYGFESVREPEEIAVADRGHVFVFDDPDGLGVGAGPIVTWDTRDPDVKQVAVDVGGYAHRYWLFTEPGTYRFQVHAKGYPVQALSMADSITSDVRQYTFHVGLLASLRVTATLGEVETDVGYRGLNVNPGSGFVMRVEAHNYGPDPATNTHVVVHSPHGVSLEATGTYSGSYDADTGVWTVGTLDPGVEQVLTLTGRVDSNVRGRDLNIVTETFATENISADSEVLELDFDDVDNHYVNTLTVLRDTIASPIVTEIATVREDAPAGTAVGNPVWVGYAGNHDDLTFRIENYSGIEAPDFTHRLVETNGEFVSVQTEIATDGALDYETAPFHRLVLKVSDGRDADNNVDASIDEEFLIALVVRNVVEPTDTRIQRSVPENTAAGTPIGEPVIFAGVDSSSGAYSYSLSGSGSERFRVSTNSHNHAQLQVADPSRLDHEIHPSFNITLHVQGTGASDETVNDSIPLTIIVTNVDETDVFPYSDPALDTGITLTLSGSGSRRTGHVTVGDLPTGGTVIRVRCQSKAGQHTTWRDEEITTNDTCRFIVRSLGYTRFRVNITYPNNMGTTSVASSNLLSVYR